MYQRPQGYSLERHVERAGMVPSVSEESERNLQMKSSLGISS